MKYAEYGWSASTVSHMHAYFMKQILGLAAAVPVGGRVLDVGCGNGSTVGLLSHLGLRVTGIDMSVEGISLARECHPSAQFFIASAEGPSLPPEIADQEFDLVVSTEVVEHLYQPRAFARLCFGALRPGGTLVCTTPYHGYAKNLCLSLLNRWDAHANPLWDGGHIKFWSKRTLSALLKDAGFTCIRITGVGRVPFLRMTMIAVAQKPITGAGGSHARASI